MYRSNFVKTLYFNHYHFVLIDLNLAYLQRHGFNTPILFKEKTGLGLQVPSQTFTVNDVRTCVGKYIVFFLP